MHLEQQKVHKIGCLTLQPTKFLYRQKKMLLPCQTQQQYSFYFIVTVNYDNHYIYNQVDKSKNVINTFFTLIVQIQDTILDIYNSIFMEGGKIQDQNALMSKFSNQYEQVLQPLVLELLADLPNSLIGAGSNPCTDKKRIQKEVSTFKDVLPCQTSNAIFVRVSSTNMHSMNVLISGSTDTPYANGLYHFQLFCDSSFPNSPPKMQLLTGKGNVRFNPNLYVNGYICLSLLGTWSGSNCEIWSSVNSNLSQIFISIQSLIMSNDIYFNEPSYQALKGTAEGNKRNRSYGMVVKLANIRYAMIEMIKKPPKGFEQVVRKHFLLKKEQILEQCQKWLKQDLTFFQPGQNPTLELNIRNNGFGNLLQKEIEQLKKVFATLKQQP